MQIKDVRFVKGAARWKDLMDDGLPEVAFVGRSNVGKSSLINMLLGRKALARTSNTPGKTQEFNYYGINEALYFVDLPGLGYARVSKKQRAHWESFIKRYIMEREPLRLVVHLVDSRHDPAAQDQQIMEAMKGGPVPYLIALTKGDKISKNQQAKSFRNLNNALSRIGLEVPVVLTSSKEKHGGQEIWQWIQDVAL
jgi:GTP-binding protein